MAGYKSHNLALFQKTVYNDYSQF